MTDALCGPSNALQNFQKHTTVDRTLQQDRLINRQGPSQGFRSASNVNQGVLDPEFDAFQAGHAISGQPDFHHPPPYLSQQFQHIPSPQQAIPQLPGWASDFQRLNISSPPPTAAQQSLRPAQAPAAAASWHQDFLRQQMPMAQPQKYSQPMLGSMAGYGMGGYAGQSFQPHFADGVHNQISSVGQGKQRTQEGAPQFDEAAFEQAFDKVQADMLEAESSNLPFRYSLEESRNSLPTENNASLNKLKEEQYLRYLGRKITIAPYNHSQEADTCLTELERLEQSGAIADNFSDAKSVLENLESSLNSSDIPAEFRTRIETLVSAVNQRLMSTYPLFDSTFRGGFEPLQEDLGEILRQQEPEQTPQKEELPQRDENDEMAATAGQLLERVSDNTSEKFQNSQFFELMRRLRDREVKVEGDKLVDIGTDTVSTDT